MGPAGLLRSETQGAVLGGRQSDALYPAEAARQRRRCVRTPRRLSFTATRRVALDIKTGKLVWYYQHLPGDDWDSDHIHERTLVHTKVSPDPKFVKWINPTIPKGQERDVVVEVAEAGDVFALDRDTGKFLWATPFPYDAPGHDVEIDRRRDRPHAHQRRQTCSRRKAISAITCSYNTRSWWSTAYDPRRNALYVPFQDACLNMTANNKAPTGAARGSAFSAPASTRMPMPGS